MTANTARVGVTLYSCVRSLRGLLLGLNTQLRFPGPFSSSVGERMLMNHFVVSALFFASFALDFALYVVNFFSYPSSLSTARHGAPSEPASLTGGQINS
jgi:hypothetical protein